MRLFNVFVVFIAALALSGFGEFTRFEDDDPNTTNFGYWRLTHDPAVRDYGNYHNTPCFSHDGRYTCYTHYPQNDKGSAEVRIIDLHTEKDIAVGTGLYPRWGNTRNRLFYVRYTGDRPYPWPDKTSPVKPFDVATGTEIVRYDIETGESVVITRGVEVMGGLDSTDTWIFGSQRFRGGGTHRENVVRVRNQPNSKFEVLDVPTDNGLQVVNPVHPAVKTRYRTKDPDDRIHGSKSLIYNLDGSKVWKGAILAEEGHHAWSGDGKYLLSGNKQISGRLWNEPFPSDLHMLANNDNQDISPMDRGGRYVCGTEIKLADLRSGHTWYVASVSSHIVYPATGDNSTLMDIDPKGSPDGTKIHFHATHELDRLVSTRITNWDNKDPGIIRVVSTERFPDSGDLVCWSEVIGYASKTATTFEGLTRQKYGSIPAHKRRGRVYPFSAYALPEKEWERGYKDLKILTLAGGDESNPLLYQKQTDCYIVVARFPYPPHMRFASDGVELIPGEAHWEIHGYRILRNGTPMSNGLLKPGSGFALDEPGAYTAVAVEWSKLESPPSLPLEITAAVNGTVLEGTPADFSWTRPEWRVGGEVVSESKAMQAPAARMELVHLHDGVIAVGRWENGEFRSRDDLNLFNQPSRRLTYENGKLAKRTYMAFDTDDDKTGWIMSEEKFGEDGFRTEYIRYGHPSNGHEISEHQWYRRGTPVKRGPGKGPDFDFTK